MKIFIFPETVVQCNFEGAEQMKSSDGELKIFHGSICYLKSFNRLDIFKDKEYITGRARLIRSHSSARISFELG